MYRVFCEPILKGVPFICYRLNQNKTESALDGLCYITSNRDTLNRIITAQWEGMGDVGSTRYEVTLLPPCLTIRVLSYSNCQEIHPLHFYMNFHKFSTLRVTIFLDKGQVCEPSLSGLCLPRL